MLDIESIYKEHKALLEGHFLLSSGNHTKFYLQSAKVLENPKTAEKLATELAALINSHNIQIDCVCSPALGGILAGYELARALGVRFIFTERVNGEMMLRRGFDVAKDERVLICEDIITTGGSALESAECIAERGGKIVAFAGLANRGFCKAILPSGANESSAENAKCGGNESSTETSNTSSSCDTQGANTIAKLPINIPLFALANFTFDIYEASSCPLCKDSIAYKPGSRN